MSLNENFEYALSDRSQYKIHGRVDNHIIKLNLNASMQIPNETSKVDVPLSKHHIISHKTLKEFFNSALRNEATFVRLMQYILLLKEIFEPVYCKSKCKNIKAKKMIQNIRVWFMWMPHNIFIGPRYRSCDPGHEFEFYCEDIVGSQVYWLLLKANFQMTKFIQTGNISSFNRAMNNLDKLLLKKHKHFDFNAIHWHFDGMRKSRYMFCLKRKYLENI